MPARDALRTFRFAASHAVKLVWVNDVNKTGYKRIAAATLVLACAVQLAGCGGGGNGSTNNPPPSGSGGGSPAPAPNPAPPPAPTTTDVSGKAADGYLAGATVCLDTNANMKCDSGEPAATTAAGGAFTLAVPNSVDASTYAIVVEVGATTVDEDTGAAVGKPFVLSAPAGESAFISPITTVVHGMLLQNPALTLDDAIEQVKLRIGASSDVDLFEDYVAAEDASDASADDYQRLHRVAQVAAKTLAENQEAILQAAATQGVDTTESGAALLALVTNQAIDGLESAAAAVDEAGDNFDLVDVTVQSADVTDLAQQVQLAETVASTTKVTIQSLMTQGTYWLWASTNQGESEYEHGFVKAGAEANRLNESWAFYDGATAAWVDGGAEDTAYYLTATGWVESSDMAANYTVSYQADGSAIFDDDNTDFALKFSAAELDVAGKPIKDYLGYETHVMVADSIAGDPVFSSGAKIYQVNFIVTNDSYVLPNWFDCEQPAVDGQGNCNVVWGAVQGHPAYSFAELLYPAGAPPIGNGFGVGTGIDIRLVAGGGVHVTDSIDPQHPVVTFTPGAWIYRTVNGEQIIMITLPDRFTSRLWDRGQQILAVRDGYVRRGTFTPAGTPETFGEINFNETAFEDIQANSSIY